jgi:dihydrolipoamide dehydrogenase
MEIFDLIIIGAGPGGYPLALRGAKKGWKVALIEADEVGGTCLNWGCIPTKALLASAHGLHLLRQAEHLGLTAVGIGFDWERIQARKGLVVGQLRQGIQKRLQQAGVTLIKGTGRLHPGRRITVEEPEMRELTAERVCLAIGSTASVPGFIPQDRSLVWTNNEALETKGVPETLLVVGGGVIGLELGQVFAEFGSKVTIVEMMPQILPGLDTATAKRLTAVFKKAGLEILTGTKVESLTLEEGRVAAVIGGQKRTFAKALAAIGRRPNLSALSGTGVQLNMQGNFLAVNEKFETSEPGVFAIGDAIPGPMLAHKATHDAMTLADQWDGKAVTADYRAVPSCVYTYPEIAWVGMSEEEVKQAGKAYKAGRSLFSANGKALAAGEGEGQIKTLVGDDGKLFGTVIWGPDASNLIMEATVATSLNLEAHALSRVIHPHPTLAEAFLEAVENGLGTGIHG